MARMPFYTARILNSVPRVCALERQHGCRKDGSGKAAMAGRDAQREGVGGSPRIPSVCRFGGEDLGKTGDGER